MEKFAFVMQLKPGFEAEYQKRHDELWPTLAEVLKNAGIKDYSIHLHPETLQLFAVLWREDNHSMDALPDNPVVKKWWAFMADIMYTNEDNSPQSFTLKNLFQLD